MELSNNLWNIISTPNMPLVNIFLIFCMFFIEAPLTFSLINTAFNIKCSRKERYLYILITGFIALISMFFLNWPYNIVLNYLFTFLIIYIIFKMNIIKTLIASVFPSMVFNLVGNLLFNPYLSIFNITFEQAQTIPIYRIPFALLMYIIVFCFILIFKYRKITVKILDNFDNKNKFIVFLNFLFGFFNIIIQSILTVNYIDILPIQFTFLNFLFLLTYFAISFFSLAKIMNLVTTTQKLESAEEYNKTLHILHDNVRGFKHDFDNIVTTFGGYVKTNDMEGLKKYYSQLEEDCQKVNNLYILNPDIINNPGIYNLLTTKYNEAEQKDIKFTLTFLLDLNELHMKIYEFARVLGILLDNSIEAASESEEKIINITFRKDYKNNRNLIIIENTYKNKDVDIQQIFNKGVSGKENHTGLGLWEVNQILKKNNNLNLFTHKDEKYFTQQLEIYY